MNRLRELRMQKGITQLELAKVINVQPGKISNFERGVYDLRFQEAIKAALFLNVSLDYLAGLSANPSMNTQ